LRAETLSGISGSIIRTVATCSRGIDDVMLSGDRSFLSLSALEVA